VRILADSNIVAQAVRAMRDGGHDVVHAGERATDPGDALLLAEAAAEKRVFITKDHDIGTLVHRDSRSHRGVMLIDDPGDPDAETNLILAALSSEHNRIIRGWRAPRSSESAPPASVNPKAKLDELPPRARQTDRSSRSWPSVSQSRQSGVIYPDFLEVRVSISFGARRHANPARGIPGLLRSLGIPAAKSLDSSWPALCGPSVAARKLVLDATDGRHKAGHDVEGCTATGHNLIPLVNFEELTKFRNGIGMVSVIPVQHS
jgi:predicted nuclease of predicted toxin-antitoxin system